MLLRLISLKLKIVIASVLLFVLLVLGGMAWVMAKPRSIEWINAYIEEQLDKASDVNSIKIGDSFLVWDGYDFSFAIQLDKVKVLENDTGMVMAEFEKVRLGISLASLLEGVIGFSEINIIEPVFHVALAQVDASKNKPAKEWLKNLSPYFVFLADKDNFESSILPEHIRVTDGKVFLNNGVSIYAWQIPQGYLLTSDNEIQGEFTLDFGNSSTVFSILSKKEAFVTEPTIQIGAENFPSYILAELFPDFEFFNGIDVVVSGTLGVALTETKEPMKLFLQVKNAEGNVDLKEYFPDTLSLKSLDAEASYHLDDKLLEIKTLEIAFPEVAFSANGTLRNLATWKEPNYVLDSELHIHEFKTNILQLYWPFQLGTEARTWVAQNMLDGKVTKAKGKFVIKEGEYGMSPPALSLIDAVVEFEDVTVQLPDPLKRITSIDGQAVFDGEKMVVTASDAFLLDTTINEAKIAIPDWWKEPFMELTIEGKTSGPAQDVLTIADRYVEDDAKVMVGEKELFSLKKPQNVTGQSTTEIAIRLPIKENIAYDEMDFAFTATLDQVSAEKLIFDKNAENLDAVINITPYETKVSAKGKLGASELEIDIVQPIQVEGATKYSIKGRSSMQEIASYGVGKMPYVDKSIYIDANGSIDDVHKVSAAVDGKDAIINMPKIGYKKPAGQAFKATFDATIKDQKQLTLENIEINSPQLSLNGNASFSSEGNINQVNLKNITLNQTQLSELTLKTDTKLQHVTIKGKVLDLRPIELSDVFDSTGSNKSTKQKTLKISSEIGVLYFKGEKPFNQLVANATCVDGFCSSVDLYAKLRDDTYFVVNVKPTGNKYTLMAESDNAGGVLKRFDLTQQIEGGQLELQAVLDKGENGMEANGVVQMRDFIAIKTSVLAKILTLASFKGIQDLFEGNGIKFNKFEAPFTYKNDVITVADGRSSGSSVGITAEGTVDFDQEVLNIKGAVVPAQGVNDLVNSIPVVGSIITAGGEEGIIAANYSIKGPFDEVDTSVNPLSFITPGILRKLFDIFPDSAPVSNKQNGKVKENAEGEAAAPQNNGATLPAILPEKTDGLKESAVPNP